MSKSVSVSKLFDLVKDGKKVGEANLIISVVEENGYYNFYYIANVSSREPVKVKFRNLKYLPKWIKDRLDSGFSVPKEFIFATGIFGNVIKLLSLTGNMYVIKNAEGKVSVDVNNEIYLYTTVYDEPFYTARLWVKAFSVKSDSPVIPTESELEAILNLVNVEYKFAGDIESLKREESPIEKTATVIGETAGRLVGSFVGTGLKFIISPQLIILLLILAYIIVKWRKS